MKDFGTSQSPKSTRQRGLMVVLNKVDTLWDELSTQERIDQAIMTQCRDTSRILGIDRKAIFPVSAQKALLGKVNGDQALLERSAIGVLERYLSEDILNR
ncbi:MAG: hypothetical protein AB2814_11805 [Candidatus Sedimenticola endophacoides]